MRIVCVTSGKGGVGKTTMTVNLAMALAGTGRRVLLLDGDMGLANLNILLGLIPKYTIYDVIRGQKSLAEVITATPYGFDLIAGASGIADLANLTDDERLFFMRGIELLGGYDFLMIDTGAGIGSNTTRFILAADEAVLVTTPHPTSLTDAYGMIKTVLGQQAKTKLKLLINCVHSAADAQRIATSLSRVTDQFMHGSLTYIGYVPLDPRIEKSILMQQPHLLLHPQTPSAQLIRDIAWRLMECHCYDESPPDKWKQFWHKLLGE